MISWVEVVVWIWLRLMFGLCFSSISFCLVGWIIVIFVMIRLICRVVVSGSEYFGIILGWFLVVCSMVMMICLVFVIRFMVLFMFGIIWFGII